MNYIKNIKYKLTWSFIIINILVFELIFSMPDPLFESVLSALDFSSAEMLQVWRLFTSLFLHANASHLFFNMLALYFFGRVMEDELSPKRWLGIYFVSGVAGNIVYGLTSTIPAVGASGCIFGLMGAAMLLRPKEMIRIYIFPLPLGFVAIMYILTQVALSAIPALGTGIAYMAHIGGLVAGSVLVFAYKPKNVLKGVLILLVLLALLLFLLPVVALAVGIGQIILGVFDYIVGLILYGAAKMLFSWIWI